MPELVSAYYQFVNDFKARFPHARLTWSGAPVTWLPDDGEATAAFYENGAVKASYVYIKVCLTTGLLLVSPIGDDDELSDSSAADEDWKPIDAWAHDKTAHVHRVPGNANPGTPCSG